MPVKNTEDESDPGENQKGNLLFYAAPFQKLFQSFHTDTSKAYTPMGIMMI